MNPLGAGRREPHVSAIYYEPERQLSNGIVALGMRGGWSVNWCRRPARDRHLPVRRGPKWKGARPFT